MSERPRPVAIQPNYSLDAAPTFGPRNKVCVPRKVEHVGPDST